MLKNTNLITLVTLLFFSHYLSAQVSYPKFGSGIQVMSADSSFTLKLGFRFQTLTSAEWSLEDQDEGYESGFDANTMIRRSRLKFGGWAVSPKLQYKAELSLSNRDNGGGGNSSEFGNAANIILDAHLTWTFYKKFYLRLGQGKLAGNRERVISSGNLQFVDRSRLNSRFTIDRDVFLQLGNKHTIGDNFIVKESVSIQQGEGKNQLTGYNGGFGYTYRLELLPMGSFQSKGDYIGSAIKREATPKLAIGLTYDNNRNAVRERGQKGSFIQNAEGDYVGKNLNSFFVDLMFKYQGLSIMAEYVDKFTEDDIPYIYDAEDVEIGTYYTGSAINVQAGYMFPSNVEIALRYTDVKADTSNDEQQYTIGLNKYIVGHKLKIQTDFTFINRDGKQNTSLWRTQVDFHF